MGNNARHKPQWNRVESFLHTFSRPNMRIMSRPDQIKVKNYFHPVRKAQRDSRGHKEITQQPIPAVSVSEVFRKHKEGEKVYRKGYSLETEEIWKTSGDRLSKKVKLCYENQQQKRMTDQCTMGKKKNHNWLLSGERQTKIHSSVAEKPRGKGERKKNPKHLWQKGNI